MSVIENECRDRRATNVASQTGTVADTLFWAATNPTLKNDLIHATAETGPALVASQASQRSQWRQQLDTHFLTPKAVCAKTSLSRGTLDRLVAAGRFPAPIRITDRRLAYESSAVEAWMQERLVA